MKSNILLIAAATFVISVIITLNLFFQQNYQAEMAEQFSKQQTLLADTISKNIDASIEHLKEEGQGLARLLGRRGLGRSGLDDFIDNAFAEVKEETIGVNLKVIDAKGAVVYDSLPRPMQKSDYRLISRSAEADPEAVVLCDRAEEQELKFGIAVRDRDKIVGTLILEASIDSINKSFLAPIKSGSKGYAWMMDNQGTLIYHPTEHGMVGKNLYKADKSCFECHKSFEVEKKILEGAGGVSSYIAPYGEDKLIAFSRIKLSPNISWIVCVSTPYSEVTASIRKSMRLHSILVIAIFGTTALAAVTLVVINRRRIKAEEKAKHEAELERYASELEHAVEKRTLELISEKEKMDAIVGALDAGLFLADAEKRIIWVNRTLEQWLGRERTKNLTIDDIYGEVKVQNSTVDNRMIREVIYHTIGSRKGYFQITSTPLAGPDGHMQLLGLITDITEIKKVEEQMVHSEKLASLGRLTAGIAHEIGNPLTSVFSFLQILRERETDDFKKESLDTILFHINRIADIVRQLSGLSKFQPAELKDVNVNEVVETALGLMQYDKRAKRVKVNKELSGIPNVTTDRNQLSQVFVNLILNAADAMPEGGDLTIRSSISDGSVVVEFEDTGAGIHKDNLQRVFDPFFTTKDKGTGLGLSVSYGIIRKLGGDIVVESEEGTGTKFTIKLPVVKK